MRYYSHWRVTINAGTGAARTVVAYGQDITEELSLSWVQQIQQAPALRRVPMRNHGRGNVDRAITLGVYTRHANHAAAMDWMWALDLAADAYAMTDVTLRVEALAGGTWNMALAQVQEASTKIVDTGRAETLTTWRILRGTAV